MKIVVTEMDGMVTFGVEGMRYAITPHQLLSIVEVDR
jgi:hypothetical protein